MTYARNMTFYSPNIMKFIKVTIDTYVEDGQGLLTYDDNAMMNPETFSNAVKKGYLLEYCELVRLLYEV